MVIAYNGYAEKNKVDQLFVPIVHLVAAMVVKILTLTLHRHTTYMHRDTVFVKMYRSMYGYFETS